MDEERPTPAPAPGLPRPLEGISIAELEAYRTLLEREIARVDAELERRRSLRSAAEALFRPPPSGERR
ncbi:MAG: DUF1192 domain-containing protein [Geminicoccaceae bacterium]|nr:DUF1192 domain-containing protein [Geminicoccaceae bacterium]MCX7630405.1 DUF1192 domain-containing protein [Geminicoccaceae bacterium]MDW8123170.1 DUF1192 domain-containing protein [Geminicoccaceae bacterium]